MPLNVAEVAATVGVVHMTRRTFALAVSALIALLRFLLDPILVRGLVIPRFLLRWSSDFR